MITAKDMLKLEEECKVPVINLMENAGKKVAEIIKEKIKVKNKNILVVAYHGNNGGDGFVAARHLCEHAEVDVLFVGDESKFSEETKANYKRIENNDRIQFLSLDIIDFSDYDIIIDAIFGTGVREKINDPLATLITKLSGSKAFKISIDVPSGVNPDTGEKLNVFFKPDLIIALHDMKQGLKEYESKTIVANIGLQDNI